MTAIREILDPSEVSHVLKEARDRAERQLSTMRSLASEISTAFPHLIVGVNGSVARREVTSGSDVDLFFLSQEEDLQPVIGIQSEYRDILSTKGIKMPSSGGVFDEPLHTRDLTSKIGGEDDTNKFITRRMLYLLEGEWIANADGFARVREELVTHYVPDDLKASKLCMFLLNDVIRYWRTICVDFEYKTLGSNKSRAIRLVKLRFSRMMLYFAGVAAIGQAVDMDVATKRKTLCTLLAQPPIERLTGIFGQERLAGALSAYATFLSAIDAEEVRNRLSSPGSEALESKEYNELIEVARKFRDALQGLLLDQCKPVPVAKALMI